MGVSYGSGTVDIFITFVYGWGGPPNDTVPFRPYGTIPGG